MQPIQSTVISLQASYVTHLPAEGDVEHASCDGSSAEENKSDESTQLILVISVLGNVLGGALLISGMFMLPHILGGLLN